MNIDQNKKYQKLDAYSIVTSNKFEQTFVENRLK